MAKARDIPISPEASFRAAAATAVEVRTHELFAQQEGVLDTEDIERVHDMRVASRRLRAVLEIFAPCFPRGQHRRTLEDVKALADALGERRDPDVAVESLERVRADLAVEDHPGLDGLIAQFADRRDAANDGLASELERAARTGLEPRLLALAAEARRA